MYWIHFTALVFYRILRGVFMEKILFIGGDSRIIYAMHYLKSKGFSVDSYGLFENDCGNTEKADIIVFPVPATKDGLTVNCPLTDKIIPFSDIENTLKGKKIFAGGKIPINEPYTNYCDNDYYAVLNAVPTAEGAISFCIENTPYTLFKSKILIIGNGRVAKVLISRLKAFKCDITVSARKPLDFALIESEGLKYINTSYVPICAKDFDIIINTVDINLLDTSNLTKDVLLVDLSSKGCIDYKSIENSGFRVYKLPGIPGKTAPETAGIILAKTLSSFIDNNE